MLARDRCLIVHITSRLVRVAQQIRKRDRSNVLSPHRRQKPGTARQTHRRNSNDCRAERKVKSVTVKSISVLAGLCFIALASCASLSEDTCRGGDWREIGFQDGARGQGPDQVFRHARACNDFGIAPNKTLWEAGRTEGLKLYCTPRNAYREGAEGDHLRPVCPIADRPALLDENERGLSWYRLDRDIDESERRIARIGSLIRDLPDTDPARATLTAERLLLRLEISRLRAQRNRFRY